MKRIRIVEFFFDFDKLRKGCVTKDIFRRILSMLGFDLTESEYQALETKYKN
jgi:Ca2+-binding EF-hand superfamily protein